MRSSSFRAGALALGSVALLLGAAGCGAKVEVAEKVTTTTVATTTTTAPPVLTKGQLAEAALGLADLPPGWAVDPPSTGGTGEGGPTDFLCPSATSPFDDSEDGVEVAFSQSVNGPFLVQSIGSAADAKAQFDAAVKAFASCVGQTWTSEQDGDTMDMTMAEASAPKVGDTARTFRVSGSSTSAPVDMIVDMVFVRRGNAMQLYGAINIQSPLVLATQLTGDQIAELVTIGDEKIATALKGKPA